jgi:hypothetical protein
MSITVHVRGATYASPIPTLALIARVASTMASSRRCASTRTLAYQLPFPLLHSLVPFYVILFLDRHHAIGLPSH